MDTILTEVSEKMDKSLSALRNAFNKIRTGRANPSILDDVKVDYYGNMTPINQTSNITIEEGRSLVISPWDKSLLPEIEKAILNSDLGLNRNSSADLIRVTMPALTEETRQNYIKQARSEAENSRVSIRNIRRDSLEKLRVLEKDKSISQDESKKAQQDLQKITDDFTSQVDTLKKDKEKELLKI